MKKVIFLNTNKVWGGGEKWHLEMAKALKNNGIDVLIITNLVSELADRAVELNIPCTRISISNLSFLNPFTKNKLRQLFSSYSNATLFLNLPSDVKVCAKIAKEFKIKTIYRRGMPHPIKRNFLNILTYKNIDLFIANSIEIKKSIAKNFPEFSEKTKIIYNGVEDKVYPPKALNYPIRIGHIGRLVEQKGFDLLLHIASLLNESHFNFELIIAGKGPDEEKIKQLASLLGIKNVTFLGHIPAHDFFSQIDLLAFTSRFEGSANSLIESLQYGVPSICFDISSMPEIIEDGYNGYLIPPFNTKLFSQKIVDLTSDKKEFKKLQENCVSKLKSKFLYKDKIHEVLNLVKER